MPHPARAASDMNPGPATGGQKKLSPSDLRRRQRRSIQRLAEERQQAWLEDESNANLVAGLTGDLEESFDAKRERNRGQRLTDVCRPPVKRIRDVPEPLA